MNKRVKYKETGESPTWTRVEAGIATIQEIVQTGSESENGNIHTVWV